MHHMLPWNSIVLQKNLVECPGEGLLMIALFLSSTEPRRRWNMTEAHWMSYFYGLLVAMVAMMPFIARTCFSS